LLRGPLTRLQLLRLCLVRFGASFLLILTTGILNRILIADLGISTLIVTLVLSFQHLTSPFALLSGHLSDRFAIRGQRRVPWIRLWTLISAGLVPLMPMVALNMGEGGLWFVAGAVLFGVFGFGLKAANLLVSALVVDATSDVDQRGRDLNFVWTAAIAGFVLAGVFFSLLLPQFDPSSAADLTRLEQLCWAVSAIAIVLAFVGTMGLEPPAETSADTSAAVRPDFRSALRSVLNTPGAREIFAFLFLADFSFFVQEFVLEAFGGEVFDLPVSVTTSFNITLGLGMIFAMFAGGSLGFLVPRFPTRRVLVASCALGALSFAVLAFSAVTDATTALLVSVFVLGIAKGLYNVGLAHLFTALARSATAGVLMGAWGAFGGFAVALGGLSGGILQQVAETASGSLATSYGLVFGVEVLGLLGAMVLILRSRAVEAVEGVEVAP
jgi:BCD family chlorophyll transporter-like MFS transporter